MRRALTLTLLAVAVSATAAEEPAPKKPSDISPDGRFLVQRFAEAIRITDLRAHRIPPEIGLARSYIVRWLFDSRTAVALQHLRGGSLATVVHYDGREWHKIEASPSDRYFGYIGVIDLAPHDGALRVVYRSDVVDDDRRSSQFLVTLEIELASGAVREHAQRISYKRYASLHDIASP